MARQSWLDDEAKQTMIDDYAQQLGSFLEAMADGRVDPHELQAQEARVVALMKEIEPQLNDAMHDKITRLLCELSAFNVMQMFSEMQPTTRAGSSHWRP